MSETFPKNFGRFELLQRLAIGGMAELFLARPQMPTEAGPRNTVVIKRLLPHMADDPAFNAMFVDEARLTARLAHPNIVETYELGRDDDQLFIVFEYVDGLDGLALLRECAHRKVRLPTEVAVYIVHEVLDALDFAHNQVDDNGQPLDVVHRDISPSNVLLSRRGEVKLVDFGIARATQRHHDTKDGTLKGKYGYMSPEQVLDQPIDARSDLFSVGIVLAEMLTGRRLFAAPTELDVLLMVRDARLDRLDKYGGHIGLDLDRILRKALSKNPGRRFSSAGEFRDALAEWLFMRQAPVTPATLGQIVESLYEDAWSRKQQTMDEAGMAKAAVVAEVSDDLATMSAAVVSHVITDEPSEVDGIPIGKISDSASLPLVSIYTAYTADSHEQSGQLAVIEPLDQGEPSVELAVMELPERGDSGSVTVEVGDLDDRSGAVPIMRPYDDEDSQAVTGPYQLKQHGPRCAAVMDAAVDATGADARDFDDSAISLIKRGHRVGSGGPGADAGNELPDDAGSFASSAPIAVLYRLAASRATGLLVTRVGGISKDIYFREGIPEYVSSNVATELFGEYLTKNGVLSNGELAMALAMMPHYRNKLGDTLVGLGLLKPLEVFRHLTRQVRQKLLDVCTWSRGSFRWYGGQENTREAFPLDLNAFEVFGAGALALPASIIDSWVVDLDSKRPRHLPTARTSPEVFQLGKLMRDVVGRIDGVRTVAELRDYYAGCRDHERFVRVLYLLVQTELVGLV